MMESYQEELARRRREAEIYVEEHYTEEEMARKAPEISWEPSDYREWLIKVYGGLLIASTTRGHIK